MINDSYDFVQKLDVQIATLKKMVKDHGPAFAAGISVEVRIGAGIPKNGDTARFSLCLLNDVPGFFSRTIDELHESRAYFVQKMREDVELWQAFLRDEDQKDKTL